MKNKLLITLLTANLLLLIGGLAGGAYYLHREKADYDLKLMNIQKEAAKTFTAADSADSNASDAKDAAEEAKRSADNASDSADQAKLAAQLNMR